MRKMVDTQSGQGGMGGLEKGQGQEPNVTPFCIILTLKLFFKVLQMKTYWA